MTGGLPTGTSAGTARADIEERVVVSVTVGFALWSALATLATLAGLAFQTLCILYLLLLPIAGVGLWKFPLTSPRPRASGTPGAAPASRWALLVLCAGCALLTFLDHRPNLDDAYYFAGRTIHYVANPGAALDLIHHQRALLDWPAEYPLLLLQNVSLFWAGLALATGVPGLAIVHFVAPVLGGALIPLAWHTALLRFLPSPRMAVVGTAVIVACLCLDGAIGHGFGWFGLPAARLGKGLLMMIGVPLFVAWSKDWFDRPCAPSFARLALVTVACAGLSDSALFLILVLATFMAAGACASRPPSVRTLKLLAGFGLSLSWMAGVGIFILGTVDRSEMSNVGFGYGFPDSFGGQLAFVFGSPPGIFFWLYTFALAGAGWALRRTAEARFLLGWAVASLLLLNPLLFPLLSEYLTSNNGYWRLFYLPPLLLGAGLAGALLAGMLPARRWISPALLAGCAIGFALLATLGGPLAETAIYSRARFAWSGYKIAPEVEADVRLILEHATPGAMLAPFVYSQTIPLLGAELPQVAVRGYMLRHTALRHGAPRLAASRASAMDYIASGKPRAARSGLVALLRNDDLMNVVIAAGLEERLGALIEQHGFRRVLREPRFVLFVRG